MDLLDRLLDDPNEDARRELLAEVNHPKPNLLLQEVAFNIYEVVLDWKVGEARVYDVLDGGAEPTVITLDELRMRLR